MGKHRKSSRSVLFQVKWFDGRHWRLAQVRGERQKARLETTLATLPWVSQVEFYRLGK